MTYTLHGGSSYAPVRPDDPDNDGEVFATLEDAAHEWARRRNDWTGRFPCWGDGGPGDAAVILHDDRGDATMCHERGEDHDYAPTFTRGRFTGEPSRPCRKCRAVTLDPLHDVDTWREEDGYHFACSCGHYAGPFPTEGDAVDASADPHGEADA